MKLLRQIMVMLQIWSRSPSHERKAFNGLALVIVRSVAGHSGIITVKAKSPGLKDAAVEVKSK